ncbi:DNA-directed primase/polymerase protein-like [Actinia tenebrosa]|uniref:DNA-directed primase/polymerase protein n=1 Tax=Actinia tenebrosa TaxID=6105 RepID=A0A6P8IR31_ACTTE|nr:DNA-directed primase/polymerase protein-like [Actinia tenebrosa]
MDKARNTSPSFKTKSFYSSKPSPRSKTWDEKQAKWEAKFQEFKKKPIPTPRLLRLDDPIPVFKRFPLQQLAFDYAKTCSKDVHVFSEEIECGGKRRYLVATFDQFWQVYRKLERDQRHYYEVIIEGAACKLYFDLEFIKDLNPDSNGIEMVEIFIKYVCHQIKQSFGISCDRKHVIDLDSSTETKFSRHLIFCLPNALFKDNTHVGNFVNHICFSILNLVHNHHPPHDKNAEPGETSEGPEPKVPRKTQENVSKVITDEYINGVAVEDLKNLLIVNNKGDVVTFCDQGVYTKNRNFRAYKSAKFAKKATLELAKENMFKPDMKNRTGSFSRDPDYVSFLDSLISNVSYNDNMLRHVKVLTFESETAKAGKRSRPSSTGHPEQPVETLPSGYQHSPFPQIDDFILTVINKGGVQGKIRRWVYFAQGKVLMFDIDKNRWCENIGRAHQSNHIIMVVDMRQGIYYQKCHDPECKKINFRSQEKPIPEEINPFRHEKDTLDESALWENDLEDDEVLYQIAEETEQSQDSELSILLADDSTDWEPWKDLPTCNDVIDQVTNSCDEGSKYKTNEK